MSASLFIYLSIYFYSTLVLASNDYEPKYWTSAHKIMEIESEVDGVTANYQLLDSIIDDVKEKTKIETYYSKKQAKEVLKTIDKVLIERNFIYKHSDLLCNALGPQKLDRKILDSLNKEFKRYSPEAFKRALSHLGENYYFSNCATTSFIYIGIGNALGFPLRAVLVPEHVFVRWHFPDGSYLNWDTSSKTAGTDEWYKNYYNLSNVLIDNGVYLRSLREKEVFGIAFSHSGIVWLKKGGLNKAIDNYNKAIELNPKLPTAYTGRGKAWSTKDELDKAIADYNKAIDIDPKYGKAYRERGFVWYKKGKLDKAIEDYNKAIYYLDLTPTYYANRSHSIAYAGRGKAWEKMGELDKAIDDYNKAIKLNPKLSVAYAGRGKAWFEKGDFDKAIDDLEKATDLYYKDAYLTLCRAYLKRGNAWFKTGYLDKAIADYNQILYISKKHPGAIHTLRKTFDKLIKTYTKAIEINPKDSKAYCRRGSVWDEKGEYDKATADYTKAIEIDPKGSIAYRYRATIYKKIGEAEKAEADRKKANELLR